MKKILSAALALSLLSATAISTEASADGYGHSYNYGNDHNRYDRNDRYDHDRYDRGRNDNNGYRNGYGHNWRRGERYHGGYAVDYRRYHLRRPPRGYHWVYADGDYLMVALTTGIIADIILHSR